MMKPYLAPLLAMLVLAACGGQGSDSVQYSESTAYNASAAQPAKRLMAALDTSNVLSNAGFETSGSGWTTSDSVLIADPSTAHSGSSYAWLGGYNSANDYIYQSVSILANATSSYLQFWYVIKTNEITAFSANDTLKVEVYNASGSTLLATLATLSNLDRAYAWTQSAQYDLSAYKGQTIRLKFTGTTDKSIPTDFLLDDIVVHAPSAATSSSPSVSGGVATFSGNRSNYAISKTASGYSVTNNATGASSNFDGTTVQAIKFADVTVNLAVGTKAATISASDLNALIELYIAYFNRVPDADGMSYWIDQRKAGATLAQIGQSFYDAAVQYSSLTGYTAAMTNADFVRLIYKNVLGRSTVDADGLNYWSNALANGLETRGTLVKTMLESAHSFKGNTTYGWVADLLDNKVGVGTYFAVQQGITYNSPSDSISKGMQIASAVTQSDTGSAKALVPTADPALNLKPETTNPTTCLPTEELRNGICVPENYWTIAPQFAFTAAPTRAETTYYLHFGSGGDQFSNEVIGSVRVTVEEIIEDPDDVPAGLAAAYKAVDEFRAILKRLAEAKTYPPLETMKSIFRSAVQKALAEEDATVAAPYAIEKFTQAGYPAAASSTGNTGNTGSPTTGSDPALPCAESYAGPMDEPQVYMFCKNAYGNSCIDRANGTSLFRDQTTTICNLLGNYLKALNDSRSAQGYCSYCNPATIP